MEQWDLYDRKGHKTDSVGYRHLPVPEGLYHIVIHVIIMNSTDDYLIQKRTLNKKLSPGLWAFTGGAALMGETSKEAALREVKEEVGLVLKDLTFIKRFYYNDYFSDYYLHKENLELDTLILQSTEVAEVAYASRIEILNRIEKKQFHPYREDVMEVIMNL